MRYPRLTVFCAMLLILAMAAPASAQRGNRGGRGGGFGGGDFRTRILERMDSNGNGFIEPDEMQGNARRLVERMADDAGMSTNRPIQISRLVAASSGGRGGRGRGRGDNNDNRRGGQDRDDRGSESPDDALYVKIPRFGDEKAVGFGLHPRLLAGRIVDLEAEYDERVLEFMERTLDRSDENKNGILDMEEWEDVRWRDADPKAADVDGDGRLTSAELAKMFQQQMEERAARRGGRGGRGRGRGGRGGRGERGGDDENDNRGSRFAAFGGGFGNFGGRGGRGGGRGGRDWGGRGDEDDDGGNRRGRGGRGGRDPAMWIANFDSDGDGVILPEDLDERQQRMLANFDVDMSQPIVVEELTQRIAAMRDGNGGRGRQVEPAKVENPPAFEVTGLVRLEGDNVVSGANQSQGGRAAYRAREPSLPQGLPDWWREYDANGDNQIVLSEYFGNARPNAEDADDFAKLDTNGDGIVTAKEAKTAN